MAEDPDVESYTSISFSCHIRIRIITNSDWLWLKRTHVLILFPSCKKTMLTTLWLGNVVNGDHSSRYSHSDIRNTTVQGNVGEEIFIWILFTLVIIIDNNGVGLSDISCVELYDLTCHWYIVTISNSCIRNM